MTDQRFQVLVWPDTPSNWSYVDRPPDASSEDWAAQVFRVLVDMNAKKPARFRFVSEAQDVFIEWLARLEAKIRGHQLHPALISHLSKYRKLMPALALLFELADRAGRGLGDDLRDPQKFGVSLAHTWRAAAWCGYLESHARRVYSCIVTPQLRAAHELAEHIRSKHIINKEGGFDWFAASNVYLKGWSGLDSPEAVRWATDVLQDACWLRELSTESGPRGGRSSSRWGVNPRVWE